MSKAARLTAWMSASSFECERSQLCATIDIDVSAGTEERFSGILKTKTDIILNLQFKTKLRPRL